MFGSSLDLRESDQIENRHPPRPISNREVLRGEFNSGPLVRGSCPQRPLAQPSAGRNRPWIVCKSRFAAPDEPAWRYAWSMMDAETRRATGEKLIVCVVQADSPLLDPLRSYYANNPGVRVQEVRRLAERRTRKEQRTSDGGPPQGERDRRRSPDRRVCERRAPLTPIDAPPDLPADVAPYVEQIDFYERPRVRLVFACAHVWPGEGDPTRLSREELERELQRQNRESAVEETRPVWIQLTLKMDEADKEAQKWFEGSLDVWVTTPKLEPTLGDMRSILELANASESDYALEHDTMLDVLPHLYGRGIFRASKDAFRGNEPPDDDGVGLFPTIGFSLAKPIEPAKDDDEMNSNPEPKRWETSPRGRVQSLRGREAEEPAEPLNSNAEPAPVFWALRTNVAVVGETVVSVRLPDLLCEGRYAEEDNPHEGNYHSHSDELRIPARFFPNKSSAAEIAEGIAHHQASTARNAAETLRDRLRPIEEKLTAFQSDEDDKQPRRREERELAERDRKLILDMSATVDELERQVSRLLRRFGSYGEGHGLVPGETKLRYGFALDEIRSLRDDCKRGMEVINASLVGLGQADRNRFELAAALLASVILTPTLVAGLFGANVRFPGYNEPRGLTTLVLAVVAFMALGILLMSVAWSKNWDRFSGLFYSRYLSWVAGIVFFVSGAMALLISIDAIL